MPKTRTPFTVWCANEQKLTQWNHLPDSNNEVLLQCNCCGRFLKFPPGITRGQLAKLLDKHEEVNTGEVKAEETPSVPVVYSPTPAPEIKKSFWDVIKDAFNN